MREVRAFGKLIDPALYREGYGWRGLVLNIVNWARVKLERWIVLNILRFEARKAGMEKQQVKHLLEDVQRDPTVRPWLFDDPMARFKSLLPGVRLPHSFDSLKERSIHRYMDGRKNSDGDRPQALEQGTPLAHTLATLAMARGDRQTRYYTGRRHQLQILAEDQIERVPPNDEKLHGEMVLAERLRDMANERLSTSPYARRAGRTAQETGAGGSSQGGQGGAEG